MPTVTFQADQAAPAIEPIYTAAVQERLRSLTVLAGGLAHNLRSPLTAIMGRAELIGVRQPEMRDKMREIVGECERMNGMLHAVTSTLALEAETQPRPMSLSDLVEGECEFMRLDRHFKHEIETELALAAELPVVHAVYGHLAQAFAAIVQNAVTAVREAAERRLTISTGSAADAVVLSVHDTGCGISAENLPHVFEPGFTTFAGRCYSDSPVEHTGRGYGLTYAAALIGRCGGSIEVCSEPGAGTTVTITLPVR
jgi:polar amino acid transport system substrate-binding protein